MKWDPKRFGWCKVLCLLELSRAYQPSNTIHTSKRRRGAASHLAKADRERLPAVQRNNAGIQTQANLEESRFSECQRPESGGGATNFSSNRTQTCCQVNVGAASQEECEGPRAASNTRFDSQRKSVEWLEDWAVSAKSKCAELMQMFPKRAGEELWQSLIVMIIILLTVDQVTMCAVNRMPRGDKLSPRLCRVF